MEPVGEFTPCFLRVVARFSAHADPNTLNMFKYINFQPKKNYIIGKAKEKYLLPYRRRCCASNNGYTIIVERGYDAEQEQFPVFKAGRSLSSPA
jgi:hypothetical protein